MKKQKVFIDCGYHLGEGMSEIISKLKIDLEWKIFAFEANPFCRIENKIMRHNLNIVALNMAVWDEDGESYFNVEDNEVSNSPKIGSLSNLDGWGSCLSDLKSAHSYKRKVLIKTIDFSNFLSQFFDFDIYIKMDIEGAEFRVLRKMIKDNKMFNIKEMWIEWHDNDLPNENENTKKILIDTLKNTTKLHNW